MIDEKIYKTQINHTPSDIKANKALRIELFYSGKSIVIEKDELPFYLGRDEESCDMMIQGDTISRRHCVLQVRDQQIGLMDTSTNGTHIKLGRAGSVFIHNDYYPLVGQGAIKLGSHFDDDDSDALLFKVASK